MIPRPAVFALHRCTGAVLAVFICLHLVNHALLAVDTAMAFAFMDAFRRIYRQPVVEALLLAAVAVQLFAGVSLARRGASLAVRLSGYYLLLFLLVHVGAVLWGRLEPGLDTDIRFAAAGLRTWPAAAFFVPYYVLAVVAVCCHVGLGVSRHLPASRLVGIASTALGLLLGMVIVGSMMTMA